MTALKEIEVLDEGKTTDDLFAGERIELIKITLEDGTTYHLHGVQLVSEDRALDSLEVVDGDEDAIEVTELELPGER